MTNVSMIFFIISNVSTYNAFVNNIFKKSFSQDSSLLMESCQHSRKRVSNTIFTLSVPYPATIPVIPAGTRYRLALRKSTVRGYFSPGRGKWLGSTKRTAGSNESLLVRTCLMVDSMCPYFLISSPNSLSVTSIRISRLSPWSSRETTSW